MRNRIGGWIAASLILALSVQAIAQPKAKRHPAQDPPRFSPPRPPPLDQDFEDPIEDDIENGDMPAHAQTPPPAPPPSADGNNGYAPPPSMGSMSGGNSNGTKLKFQIADGEFYQKGKKRGRTPQNKRNQ